ncbi:RluA family pseudouridine synthase [Paenalcaligenes niemegkensis]|uniref:RluA family pseudouridine synthase n=1 Tax=Paenalcaligenes niemegkensis TaxID=2895469 RepID=UPI001EE99866|nr:RluA family pseudouridine synthase [Paenalcaligenes niemegkensis]MCQ9615660.1 RluA family pseudouridine synthase [Paenalcaligenes niemegkensis]
MPDTNTDKKLSAELAGSRAEARVFKLPISAEPERLDKTLARLIPEHSRSRLQSWIEGGHVQVNNEAVRSRQTVYPGDVITVWEQAAPEETAYEPENIDFPVVKETDHWIIVNKPAGLVTHPGAGNWSGTLLNGLLFRYPELKGVARAGIVHRLDKDTSGLMVVARTDIAQTHLVRQLQERSVKREYLALVHGFPDAAGVINAPVGRDARVPVRMTTVNGIAAREAITHFECIRKGLAGRGVAVSEVICRLQTGRTHQIRVHMASLKHPLLGDEIYGGKPILDASRQMLHARALAFIDPHSERLVEFESELPEDFEAVRQQIQWKK